MLITVILLFRLEAAALMAFSTINPINKQIHDLRKGYNSRFVINSPLGDRLHLEKHRRRWFLNVLWKLMRGFVSFFRLLLYLKFCKIVNESCFKAENITVTHCLAVSA